jgi:hypothetical protein
MEDTKFTAVNARSIKIHTIKRLEKPYRHFHSMIVKRIRYEAGLNKEHLSYTLPSYSLELPDYDPQKALGWLENKLLSDGFSVTVNRQRRNLMISWAPPPPKAPVSRLKASRFYTRY